jgi:AbrB family looped-hinge helix DNA binding protein
VRLFREGVDERCAFKLSFSQCEKELVMPTVKVKENFQVTIPAALRAAAGLAIGDYLEVVLEGRSIVLKPKTITNGNGVEAAIQEGLHAVKEGRVTPAFSSMEEVEAAIAEGLQDVKAGRLIGPFSNMTEFEEYQAKKRKK